MGWVVDGAGVALKCPACFDHLAHCRLSEHERTHSLSSVPFPAQRDAHAGLGAILERGWGWATLWGQNGAGKSHLITAAIADAARAGREAKYYEAADVLAEFRAGMGDDQSSPSQVLDRLGAVPVLAIDELTKFHWSSDWFRAQMQALISRRYRLAQDRRGITLFGSEIEPGEPVLLDRGGRLVAFDWCPSDVLSRMRDVDLGVNGAPALWQIQGMDMRSVPRF